jgi:myo-inositol-1(or 4)-monophosphatase
MTVDSKFLKTAIEIAVKAGEIQLERQGSDLVVDKKGPIDIVTEVDVEIERFGRDLIAKRFPTHSVLGEEFPNQPEASSGSSSYCWMFDPIDGTVNYAHGLPIYCCSLALEVDGQIELGVIFDPSRQELFVAERGGGARLNGTLLTVSTETNLGDSMLCTGFPYDVHETVDEVVGLFGSFVSSARAVRRLGSAALDLCYVAAGRFDGFWEQRLFPWDLAAGALMIEEAGGRVSGLGGDTFDPRAGAILASNGPLHGQMIAVIQSFESSRTTGGIA